MDITFKFQKTPAKQWRIEWTENDEPCVSLHPSRTKAFSKMHRLIAPELKDSFEVTYHIP